MTGNPTPAGQIGLTKPSGQLDTSYLSLNLDDTINNRDELWVVCFDFEMTWQLGHRYIILEVDSTTVLNFFFFWLKGNFIKKLTSQNRQSSSKKPNII